MVEGCTILLMKGPNKGADVTNYRPILCLNLLWKLLFSDKIYKTPGSGEIVTG